MSDQEGYTSGIRHIYRQVAQMIEQALKDVLGNIIKGGKVQIGALQGSATPGQAPISGAGGTVTWATPSGGTVTSIGLSMPGEWVVGGSPVTGAGTLTVTKSVEAANTVWAGPTSGGSGAPTFRVLVVADVPALPASQITSGTFATARLPVMGASGGGHAPGSTPDTPSVAGSVKFLCENGTWITPIGVTTLMTDIDDLIVGGVGGVPTRFPAGNLGAALVRDPVSGHLGWLPVMVNPMTGSGALVIGGAAGVPQQLIAGANSAVLQMISGAPAWSPFLGTLATLQDVSIVNLQDRDTLDYRIGLGKWANTSNPNGVTIIEDGTGNTVIEDGTGNGLVAA